MPKLRDELAARVDESEAWEPGTGYTVLEPGIYLATLKQVTPSDQPGKSGSYYWTWEYEYDQESGRAWDVTSLSDKAFGKMKAVFQAFGVPSNTDTDLLLGRKVALQIDIEVQQQGKNQGKERNVVLAVLPPEEADGYEPPVSNLSKPSGWDS